MSPKTPVGGYQQITALCTWSMIKDKEKLVGFTRVFPRVFLIRARLRGRLLSFVAIRSHQA